MATRPMRKMLSITSCQGNGDQNDNGMSLHTTRTSAYGDGEKGILIHFWPGCGLVLPLQQYKISQKIKIKSTIQFRNPISKYLSKE